MITGLIIGFVVGVIVGPLAKVAIGKLLNKGTDQVNKL